MTIRHNPNVIKTRIAYSARPWAREKKQIIR